MKPLLWLAAAPLLLAAGKDSAPAPRATLNVRQTDGSYKLVDRFKVPETHAIHDGMIAFEGPGWESDKVAYRLYLDERNVPDVYGKKLPGAVLPKIGMGKDDYHTMADWGMDIFQVNQSLGLGGIGVLRDGRASQLGKSRIEVQVRSGRQVASVQVDNRGFPGADGPADLMATYSIHAGSRLTHVEARTSGKVPAMVAGLTQHKGAIRIPSPKDKPWRYLATWGEQSLAKDGLGIALFYPADEVESLGYDDQSLYVRFCDPRHIRYAFAAAWVQEPAAPKDARGFRKWLDETVNELGRIKRVRPAGQKLCTPR